MLTAKGKYGLKALSHLARLKSGETGQASDIARSNNIPKKFLDAILADLRRAGFIHARKGLGGGYVLARASSEIKIGSAIRALDGPLARSRAQVAPLTSHVATAPIRAPAKSASRWRRSAMRCHSFWITRRWPT